MRIANRWPCRSGYDVGCFVCVYEFRHMRQYPIVRFSADDHRIYCFKELSIAVVLALLLNDIEKTQIIIGFSDITVCACCNIKYYFSVLCHGYRNFRGDEFTCF